MADRGRWRLHDTKARFSEVVRQAQADWPQRVTLHGRDAVVIVDTAAFDQGRGGPGPSGGVLSGYQLDTTVVSELRRLKPDLFIAATAAEAGLTVVTRDTAHFEAAGVAVLNPWVAESVRLERRLSS